MMRRKTASQNLQDYQDELVTLEEVRLPRLHERIQHLKVKIAEAELLKEKENITPSQKHIDLFRKLYERKELHDRNELKERDKIKLFADVVGQLAVEFELDISARDKEILSRIAAGETYKAIGQTMNLGMATPSRVQYKIYRKVRSVFKQAGMNNFY